jgi:hypothetical protein
MTAGAACAECGVITPSYEAVNVTRPAAVIVYFAAVASTKKWLNALACEDSSILASSRFGCTVKRSKS